MNSMNMSGPQHAQFLQDFTQTLGSIKDCYIEIAFADQGTSRFNQARYFEALDAKTLVALTQTEKNLSFLNGCSRSFLPVELGKLGKRLATDQCVRQKNLMVFDLDFKDCIGGYSNLSPEQQNAEARRLTEQLRAAAGEHSWPLWLLNLSGHGLHAYFKLFTPLDVTPITYKQLYAAVLEELSQQSCLPFDRSCCNAARLIRLPLSTNWKDAKRPVTTEILAYHPDADGGPFIRQFLDKAQPKGSAYRTKHNAELLAKLDLEKVLRFFGYEKFASVEDRGAELVCSSPFSEDKTPSFCFNKQKKLFHDHSTSRSGDLFNLIAFFTELDIKRDFRTVLQYARRIAEVHEEAKSIGDGRYELNHSGVWFLGASEAGAGGLWVCSFVEILAASRDLDNSNWGLYLRIRDQEGCEKSWAMPMELLAGDGRDLRKKLLQLGVLLNLSTTGKTHLTRYLTEKRPTALYRMVTRLGWYGRSFVFPDTILSADNTPETIVLADPQLYRSFKVQGTLREWQENIARYAQGNSLLITALALAFCPPLLQLTGDENFGLHLVGPSSIGKTITLDVAGSVWGGGGDRGYKTRWRTTVNGLEALAGKHNDTLLTLDELAEVSPRSASAAAYMLANGSGKVRGNADGGLQAQTQWRLAFLSTGEIDLATHLESEQLIARAGQEIRLISLDADQDKGLGIFEQLHDCLASVDLADKLRQNARRYHGTAIRTFISGLTCHKDPLGLIETHRKYFKTQFGTKLSHGQTARVLDRFALLFAAAALASEFRVLPVPHGELYEAVRKQLEFCLAKHDGGETLEASQILIQIRLYLQMHGLSRFPELSELSKGQTVASFSGVRKRNSEGEHDWLVFADVFQKEICKGLDHKMVIRTLTRAKLIRFEVQGRSTCTLRIPQLGKFRIYHILHEINCEEPQVEDKE